MFYAASKALAPVTEPWAWACALGVLALALLALRRRALAGALGAGALAVLALFASPLVVDGLQRHVETSARTTARADAEYDAALVLAGEESRVVAGAQAVVAGRARYLVYSGYLDAGGMRALKRRLRAMGVPDDRIVLEPRARNTYENAVETAAIARQRGWQSLLMITSAAHVERALGCFRRLGLEPDVLAVGRAPPLALQAGGRSSWPSRAALRRTSDMMHEVIGRAVYRVVGYAA